jgi:hypothetical protein
VRGSFSGSEATTARLTMPFGATVVALAARLTVGGWLEGAAGVVVQDSFEYAESPAPLVARTR